ncbi:MAG: M16 family metallopeptidase [Gemmatimonadaceae bacterium]
MGAPSPLRAQADPPPPAQIRFRTGPVERPVQAAERVASDTATSRFDVAGVRVILRRNSASDVVAANLYLLGGTQQLTPRTAGIEALLLAASERGTRRYSRDALQRAVARTGAVITIDPAEDWTLFGLRTLRGVLDSSWAVFADRLVAPRLDSVDVELVRAQLLTAARQRRDQPDAEVTHLADSLAFTGHPYALAPEGTEQSLAAITVDQLRRYHADQMVTSRMLLVLVGNVDRPTVERLVRETLGRLPTGRYVWTPPAPPAARRATVLARRDLPTNYILGYYVGPPASHPDYAALRVASAVLSGSLFSEIRSRRNLTYAVDAPFIERAIATGGLYVTTVSPDTTLALMRREVELLKTELLDRQALQRLVQRFITDYYLRNETNADQATALARAELYEGDYRAASRLVDRLREVTPEDVRRVARRYMRDFQFAYVGDPRRVNPARLETF